MCRAAAACVFFFAAGHSFLPHPTPHSITLTSSLPAMKDVRQYQPPVTRMRSGAPTRTNLEEAGRVGDAGMQESAKMSLCGPPVQQSMRACEPGCGQVSSRHTWALIKWNDGVVEGETGRRGEERRRRANAPSALRARTWPHTAEWSLLSVQGWTMQAGGEATSADGRSGGGDPHPTLLDTP
jgi:hypothetical protein